MLPAHLQKLSTQEELHSQPPASSEGKGSGLQLCQLSTQLLQPSVSAAQGEEAVVLSSQLKKTRGTQLLSLLAAVPIRARLT